MAVAAQWGGLDPDDARVRRPIVLDDDSLRHAAHGRAHGVVHFVADGAGAGRRLQHGAPRARRVPDGLAPPGSRSGGQPAERCDLGRRRRIGSPTSGPR